MTKSFVINDHHYYYRRRDVSLKDILSVMIYCNYTHLQYEFSKTYRKIKDDETKDEIKERHRNFYWFGKYLKECVNWFGQRVLPETRNKFYHGIGEEMQFPTVADRPRGVKIYGPISTTSSFEVAVNFANTNGLIVEFGGNLDWFGSGRYFRCDWLSDFPNEKEHLFIQNECGHFNFQNIIRARSGHEFGIIIKALQAFNDLIRIHPRVNNSVVVNVKEEADNKE